jgi:hypothetical protein
MLLLVKSISFIVDNVNIHYFCHQEPIPQLAVERIMMQDAVGNVPARVTNAEGSSTPQEQENRPMFDAPDIGRDLDLGVLKAAGGYADVYDGTWRTNVVSDQGVVVAIKRRVAVKRFRVVMLQDPEFSRVSGFIRY